MLFEPLIGAIFIYAMYLSFFLLLPKWIYVFKIDCAAARYIDQPWGLTVGEQYNVLKHLTDRYQVRMLEVLHRVDQLKKGEI